MCGGVDFIKLTNEYIQRDKGVGEVLDVGALAHRQHCLRQVFFAWLRLEAVGVRVWVLGLRASGYASRASGRGTRVHRVQGFFFLPG